MISKNLFCSKSSFVAFFIVVALISFHFYLPKYDIRGAHNELSWDILSYYLYLPLTFIHGDIGINDPNYIQHIFDQYHFSPAFYQAAQAKNGNWVMIYTMGMAILYAPFFLIGHIWAINSGYPADGFSYPYQFCVSSGMMLYIIVGVFFLRKILLTFFNDCITSIVLIIVLLGTNYFREATDYNMGPHAILFTFYSILLYSTIKWHNSPKLKYAIAIGLAIGFATLIRPTEAICVFIPMLWSIKDKKSLRNKITLVKENYKHFLVLLLVVFLVGLPQMIYWKHQTGSFLYNSYWNQNSFTLSESYFLKVFFSIRKGWFVYTPLIILAFLGFLYLGKNLLKDARLAIFVFITLNIFILTHVPVWFNAGSFGQRFMVQSYVILAIPLGAFIQYFSDKSFLKKSILGIFCFLALSLNLFQTWQFVRWIIPGDGMTWEYYKYSFFKTTYMTEEEKTYLELQRTYNPNETFDDKNPHYKKQIICYHTMENASSHENSEFISQKHFLTGKQSFRISEKAIFSPGIDLPFNEITSKDHAWIRFSVWFYTEHPLKEDEADIVLLLNHKDKPYQYCTCRLDDKNYKLNRWNKITVDYLTPLLQDEHDRVSGYVWYRGDKELFLDDISVEAFVRKN